MLIHLINSSLLIIIIFFSLILFYLDHSIAIEYFIKQNTVLACAIQHLGIATVTLLLHAHLTAILHQDLMHRAVNASAEDFIWQSKVWTLFTKAFGVLDLSLFARLFRFWPWKGATLVDRHQLELIFHDFVFPVYHVHTFSL